MAFTAVTVLHGFGSVLGATFTFARVLLWALTVATAWWEIIEKVDEMPGERPRKTAGERLEELLAEQSDTGSEAPQRPAPGAAPRPPPVLTSKSQRPIGMVEVRRVSRANTGPATPSASRSPLKGASPEEEAKAAEEYAEFTSQAPAMLQQAREERSQREDQKGLIKKAIVRPLENTVDDTTYMLYRAFDKASHRMESSIFTLTESLEGSINFIGVEAIRHAETLILRRYLKFFGAVILATVVLLPLPSVQLSLALA